jgi:hypothetical protein
MTLALLHGCGFLFLATWISKIITHHTVSIRSNHCGFWTVNATELGKQLEQYSDPETLYENLNSLAEYETNGTAAVAAYVRSCYGTQPEYNTCNFLTNRRIPYKSTSNAPCPFKQGQCIGGDNAAFVMDTGDIPVTFLGVNTKSTLSLRRQTTCSPIVMEPYGFDHPSGSGRGYSHLTYRGVNVTRTVRSDTAEPYVFDHVPPTFLSVYVSKNF